MERSLQLKSCLLVIAFLISSPVSSAMQETTLLIQNPGAHTHISLNGPWKVIIDPYENGFYNYRYEEHNLSLIHISEPTRLC